MEDFVQIPYDQWKDEHKEEFEFDEKQFAEFATYKPKLVKLYLDLKNKGVQRKFASEFTSEYCTLDDVAEFVIKGLAEKNIKLVLTRKDYKGQLGFLHFKQV